MLPAPILSSQLETQVGPVKMEGEMQGEPRNGCSLKFFLPKEQFCLGPGRKPDYGE